MAVFFVDSSALAKRYVREAGSSWLRSVLSPAAGNETYVARITGVELVAGMTRRERGGSLTRADATTAPAAVRADLASEYLVVELTEALLERAMILAEKHGLRGYDAVQLSAASEVHPPRARISRNFQDTLRKASP
ncbi:MAG: type II toxin-antitoxin system VapC family toxin [Planctomycetes bacterium]|nr:type II toxin-antitoxin system VapC family toxin [Planctomycetota bacterium]